MLVDSLDSCDRRASVCVVGAGPVGIGVTASPLERGIGCYLLERGGLDQETASDDDRADENAGIQTYPWTVENPCLRWKR